MSMSVDAVVRVVPGPTVCAASSSSSPRPHLPKTLLFSNLAYLALTFLLLWIAKRAEADSLRGVCTVLAFDNFVLGLGGLRAGGATTWRAVLEWLGRVR